MSQTPRPAPSPGNIYPESTRESRREHHFHLRFQIYDLRLNGVWFASNSREAGLRNREPWRCNSSHADHSQIINYQS